MTQSWLAQPKMIELVAQLASACLRGVLEAVKTAFSSGGPQAAVDQATALAGSCRGAAS